MVESKDANLSEGAPQRADLSRCPACYMIQDYILRDFRCTLTRCPRVFVNIQPSNRSQPAVRVEPRIGRQG